MSGAENTTEAESPAGASVPLRKRILDGGIVIVGGFGIGQVLRLVSNLALARLLAPEAFGLMAIAISINVWAMMLTDIGINISVIRSSNSDKAEFIQTAWTMQILRNVAIWLFICLTALGIYLFSRNGLAPQDSIFANPLLPIIMVMLGGELLINGFMSMNRALAERALAMKRIVAMEIGARLVSMVVAIGCAFYGLGVFALLIGSAVGTATTTFLSFVLFSGPRMRFRIDKSHFHEIFNFGKWLIVASTFGFILSRGDQLIFGWLMEEARFSLYAVATMWILAAMFAFETIFRRVLVAAFSEIVRERPDHLYRAYKKIRLVADGLSFGVAYGVYLLAAPVANILYPENFSGVGYFMQLLSPMLMLWPYRLIGLAAMAAGDSKNFSLIPVVGGTAMVLIVPAAFTALGEKAAVIVFACAALISFPFAWRLGKRLKIVDPFTESRVIVATVVLVGLLLLTVN